MGLRRQAREMALKGLYLIDITDMGPEEAFEIIRREVKFNSKLTDFARIILEGTANNMKTIDSMIEKYSENWTLDRMAVIDRNILRIGTFELLKMEDTPVNVIINEAIEIAKKYSNDDSNKFVNGILDKIKNIRKETAGENKNV